MMKNKTLVFTFATGVAVGVILFCLGVSFLCAISSTGPISTDTPGADLPTSTVQAIYLEPTQQIPPTADIIYLPSLEPTPQPTYTPSYPADITAICEDGSYSYSQNARGTCSGHGGVRQWINKP